MRFNILFLLTVFVGLTFFSFVNEDRDKSSIYWDDRSLTWDDFKGHAPSSTPYVALTFSSIKLLFGGEENEIWFTIETIFDPKQSWKKKNVDEFILKHEQGHFDITEIHSRLLRKKLAETKFKKYETIGSEVEKIFNANYKACDKMQDQYDNETAHSKIKNEQVKWNNKINQFLDSLSAFSMTELKLDVGYLTN